MARRLMAAAVALVLLLSVACDDAADDHDVDADEAEEAEQAPPGGQEPDEVISTPDDEPTEPEVVEESPPRVPVPDADEMALLTPAEGEGPWPELAWEAVEGAERYDVTLYAASGRALWRWRGEETAVLVGGFDEVPDETSAVRPRVHEPMTWAVVARDDDGGVLAQSGERPVAP